MAGLTTLPQNIFKLCYTFTLSVASERIVRLSRVTHGSFIAFDMAVDDFSHGNAVTTWVRVRSNKENHIRLSEYLTKGRMVLVGEHCQLHCGRTKTATARSSLHHGGCPGVHQYR